MGFNSVFKGLIATSATPFISHLAKLEQAIEAVNYQTLRWRSGKCRHGCYFVSSGIQQRWCFCFLCISACELQSAGENLKAEETEALRDL